jgi:hypothetical protein
MSSMTHLHDKHCWRQTVFEAAASNKACEQPCKEVTLLMMREIW